VIPVERLARAAHDALAWVSRQPDVSEAEVFVAANAALCCRLNYTSHIPSNGVEEPKSTESHGIGIQVVFRSPQSPGSAAAGLLIGFGSEPADLTPSGVERAFAKARRGAVADPEFVSLPRPSGERRALDGYHDRELMAIDDEALLDAGWKVVTTAVRTLEASSALAALAGSADGMAKLGLIVGGDVSILQERIAVASTHLPDVQTDESALIAASVTAMVEAADAKGSGWSTGTRLAEFTGEAGAEAAQHALDALRGDRVPSGRYTVVFGPQPVAELLSNLVLPACTASAFYTSSTPFRGKLGHRVASPGLSIVDDGAVPGRAGSKGITCEGLPTGRTPLVRDGRLTACLSNWYESRRLLRDPALGAKLGAVGPAAEQALAPRNGFRFGGPGGRQFDTPPGISASNVIVEGRDAVPLDRLVARVGHGLLVGRIWYCYAINGLAAGDFTCTVVGDSYIIRDGRIAEPLAANAIRINDNIVRVLECVIGVGDDSRGTVLWAADEVVYAPSIAVANVPVDAIALPVSAGTHDTMEDD
jgi:PmbA protein